MNRKYNLSVSFIHLFIVLFILSAGQTACKKENEPRRNASPDMTPVKALDSATQNLLKLKSYRYSGTSEMIIEGRPELSGKGTFDTRLSINNEGALDGHMIVSQPGYSYETYSYRNMNYTRIKGGEWYRESPGSKKPGQGMVSLQARRIIAKFAELAEEVKFDRVTDEEYVISLKMGPKYYAGAKKIVPAEKPSHKHDDDRKDQAGRDTRIIVTVDRKSMHFVRILMTDITYNATLKGKITVITDALYSEFNKPVDIMPGPDVLRASGH